MTQDTRKDRRVKIVSLNVRYKSATVDEFIENHAHDVSRGGIYIKTANPFPPGHAAQVRDPPRERPGGHRGRRARRVEARRQPGQRASARGHGREVHQDRRALQGGHRQAGEHEGRRRQVVRNDGGSDRSSGADEVYPASATRIRNVASGGIRTQSICRSAIRNAGRRHDRRAPGYRVTEGDDVGPWGRWDRSVGFAGVILPCPARPHPVLESPLFPAAPGWRRGGGHVSRGRRRRQHASQGGPDGHEASRGAA